MAKVIDTLRDAINQGAAGMEMLSDERTCDGELSDALARMAQRLTRMAGTLDELMIEVDQAEGYPKIPIYRAGGSSAEVSRLPIRQPS